MKRDFHGGGGGWKGGKKFGGGFGGPKFGGSRFGGDRREVRSMHQAVCNECGSSCEVPFKPNGRKPVLCNNCFGKGGDDNYSAPRSNFRESSFEKKMYRAECASCGTNCEVPFRPTGIKPVYCNNCFGKDGGSDFKSERRDSRPEKRSESYAEQFKQVNAKLDAIMKALNLEVEEAKPEKKPVKLESEETAGDDLSFLSM